MDEQKALALLASREAMRDLCGVAAPGGKWVADAMRDGWANVHACDGKSGLFGIRVVLTSGCRSCS
jgi:hypothetical protein